MPPGVQEIRSRLRLLAAKLREKGLHGALVRYPLNIFYLSGTFVDGHLVVTEREESYLLVYRTLGRAKEEAKVSEIISFRSLRQLPGFLKDLGLQRIGLEYDRLPARVFFYYQDLLAEFELSDLTPLLWALRARKSPYEIECLRQAASMLAEALEAFLPKLRPGMSELEAAGLFEAELRKRGHPAYTRTYAWHQELAYGHLLFGDSAAVPSYLTTGQGGPGVWGYPQGPGVKRLKKGELILIDYAGWYEGYMVDQTRIFACESLPQDLIDLYKKICSLISFLEKELSPGLLIEKFYHQAMEQAEALGLGKCLMAHGEEGVNFIGHGVGLEIDEWPPVAPKVKVPFEPGMVIALEPKCHLPGIGVIGLEDTFLITSQGAERLTLFPRELLFLKA